MRRNKELENENAVLQTLLSHALASLGCADFTGGAKSNTISPENAPSLTNTIQMLSQP
jgi:hypothetical protein